jgi:hypothetical protein
MFSWFKPPGGVLFNKVMYRSLFRKYTPVRNKVKEEKQKKPEKHLLRTKAFFSACVLSRRRRFSGSGDCCRISP